MMRPLSRRLPGIALGLVMSALSALAAAADSAQWMPGGWGVRVVIPAGSGKLADKFSPLELAAQIGELQTAGWVMVNISAASFGHTFTSPRSALAQQIGQPYAPRRDLFGELARALQARNFKVIAYFASQCPGNSNIFRRIERGTHHSGARAKAIATTINDAKRRWTEVLERNQLDDAQGCHQLVRELSEQHGTEIDGWWFDHGRWASSDNLIVAALAGNAAAQIAWNEKHATIARMAPELNKEVKVWLPKRSHPLETYSAGHVTPTRKIAPSSLANLAMLESLENRPPDPKLHGHLFIPMQQYWRAGKPLFSSEKLRNWTRRIIVADGAITWAPAMAHPEFHHSRIAAAQFRQLLALDKSLRGQLENRRP